MTLIKQIWMELDFVYWTLEYEPLNLYDLIKKNQRKIHIKKIKKIKLEMWWGQISSKFTE